MKVTELIDRLLKEPSEASVELISEKKVIIEKCDKGFVHITSSIEL